MPRVYLVPMCHNGRMNFERCSVIFDYKKLFGADDLYLLQQRSERYVAVFKLLAVLFNEHRSKDLKILLHVFNTPSEILNAVRDGAIILVMENFVHLVSREQTGIQDILNMLFTHVLQPLCLRGLIDTHCHVV